MLLILLSFVVCAPTFPWMGSEGLAANSSSNGRNSSYTDLHTGHNNITAKNRSIENLANTCNSIIVHGRCLTQQRGTNNISTEPMKVKSVNETYRPTSNITPTTHQGQPGGSDWLRPKPLLVLILPIAKPLVRPTQVSTSKANMERLLINRTTELDLTTQVEYKLSNNQIVMITCYTWKLWKDKQFQVLDNGSVFVNVTNKLYDSGSQYVWENHSIWVCENNQTTNSPAIPPKNKMLFTLTFAGMLMSIISLVFVLVTYSLFTELRTPPGINLMNLSASILLAQLLWVVGSGHTDKPMACTAIALFLQYLFLVSFVWTSIIAFDTWRAFNAKASRPMAGSKRKRAKQTLRYMAVGWIAVFVYVVICVILDQSDTVFIGYGSRDVCWIADNNSKLYFFIIPVGLVIIFNIVFFSMTVKAIKDSRNQARLIADHLERKRQFGVYVRIASLMGFTWVIGFALPFGWQSEILVYAFVVLNSLQGVYIAIAFALNNRTRKLYTDLIRGKWHLATEKKSARQNANTTTSRLSKASHCDEENLYSENMPAAV